jgi:EAL domain-containing protein (putative c-di-GMP-specific phosphodiesterase class I)
VVILTADASSRARERALTSGAKDFLVKPFDRTELLLRVRNLLETRQLYARLHEHTAELEAQVSSTLELERQAEAQLAVVRERIENVLSGRRLSMVFQPIIDLDAGTVVGVEALARFAAEPRRSPDQWFAEATDVGLGVELELEAVLHAVEVLHHLPEACYLSVNLSPDAMCSAVLVDQLRRHSPERLVLEMTEHAQVADYQQLATVIDELRGSGVRLAVDDAGAGFSSLQHILRLHPDIIKLDLTLTRDIHRDPVRRALAASLVTFAREISAELVAEGVESAAEVGALRQLGVSCGQGFGLARPEPWSVRTTMPIGRWYRSVTGG